MDGVMLEMAKQIPAVVALIVIVVLFLRFMTTLLENNGKVQSEQSARMENIARNYQSSVELMTERATKAVDNQTETLSEVRETLVKLEANLNHFGSVK